MSEGIDKAIFRAAKLKKGRSKSSLGTSWRHQEEHERAADISCEEKSKENRTKKEFANLKAVYAYINKAIKRHNEIVDQERAEKIAKGVDKKKLPRNLRNDAAIACECIFTFSPDMKGKIDLNEWYDANMEFIEKEFTAKGAVTLRIDCHVDEKTPHIHYLFCPITKEGKISANEFLGGAENLSKMQDRYAKAMEQFDLTRGYSRYNVYKAVQAKAVAEGFSSSFKGVTAYCEKHGIPVPERKRHTSKTEWLAGLERQIVETKKQLSQVQKEIKQAEAERDEVKKAALEKDYKYLKDRNHQLEGFIEQAEIKRLWHEYLRKPRSHEKAKTGWEIADDILK